MARALKALVVERPMGAPADHGRGRHGDLLEGLTDLQTRHDPRRIRNQVLGQIAHLGPGIGDDLLALAVIELLGDLQRLGRRPAEPGRAEFLQRGEIMELGRALLLVLDPHAQRTRETLRRLDHQIGLFALQNPLLRRMPHLEGAPRDLCGRDDLKIGHGDEVTDFQLAFANDRQRRRLDPSNADDAARALAQDDGCGAREREVVDLIRLAPRDGGCVKLGIVRVWPGAPEGLADGLGVLRGEENAPDLPPVPVVFEYLLADQLPLPVAIGGEPDGFGGPKRLPDRPELGRLVSAVGWLGGVEPFGTQQNGRPALPFRHGVLGLFQIQQVAFGWQNIAISGPHCGPHILGLTGFLRDDDLVSHDRPRSINCMTHAILEHNRNTSARQVEVGRRDPSKSPQPGRQLDRRDRERRCRPCAPPPPDLRPFIAFL